MAPVQLDSNQLLLYYVVLVVSCFVIIRSFCRSGHKRGGPVLPPSPRALPVIGNLHQLGRSHHHRKLLELSRHHGPVFLLRLGSVPTLVVSSASVAEEVLKTQDHVFCGRPLQRTAYGLLYDGRDIAFSAYGERWRQLRRIAVLHLLSAKRVDSFRALREEAVASLVEQIRAASAHVDGGGNHRRGVVVHLSELFISLTYTVISRAAFGNKLGGMEPAAIRAMMKETTVLLETIAVSDVFPRLGWVDWATGLDARTKRTASKLDAILEGALQEHEKSSGRDADDLLDELLWVVKEAGAGLNLDRTDLKGLILDLFPSWHRHNLQNDGVDNGRASEEPKGNGESTGRAATNCRGTRTGYRGAAKHNDTTTGCHERSYAVASTIANPCPPRGGPGHQAPWLRYPSQDPGHHQRVGDRQGQRVMGGCGCIQAREVCAHCLGLQW